MLETKFFCMDKIFISILYALPLLVVVLGCIYLVLRLVKAIINLFRNNHGKEKL